MSLRVRAHGAQAPKDSQLRAGGQPGVLGIRREDKNKWERRAPVAPRHVRALVGQGLKVIVQPSTRRVFTDKEYEEAGAIIQEDLTECATIAAVKEVPIDLLLPNRTWIFFSHTIKAQPAGMPLLDAALEKKVRLVDYECITETGQRGGPRLVAFGNFAGYAGAIDFLRGLGERFLALGYSTPLLHIGSAFMYSSLEEAQRAVAMAGEAIRRNGLPQALCPFTAIFTGKGNVTQGALDIFKLLPHEMIDPGQLPMLAETGHASNEDCNKLFLSITTAEHMVRHSGGRPFDKDHYYSEPDQYESVFQDTILPHSTVIVNGMYWDERFPRLFTHDDLHRHVVAGNDRLLGVCDITCDADGSVPTRQFTSIEQPFFVFNALTEQTATSLDEPGVLFHAVDHLPSELPREASEHFGNCLLQFLPALVAARAPEAPGQGDTGMLPLPMRGAVIAEGGQLTREYQYIQQLRAANTRMEQEEREMEEELSKGALHPHGVQAPPACIGLELSGHLFDTKLINKILDLVEAQHGRVHIQNLDVASTVSDESHLTMLVMAQSQEKLDKIVSQIGAAANEVKVAIRRSGSDSAPVQSFDSLSLSPSQPRRSVLVLGSGFVVGPLVEYLLRRPENVLTVASLERSEVEAFAQRFGSRVRPQVLDVLAPEAEEARETLVKASEVIVSLVPATMHVGIAKLAIRHRKHMVTASYVSEEMQSLDADARDAGVLIINEVGLDPGIDHMSAMQMIHQATAGADTKVLRFSSLCGGLPAPEAAGSSPLGYKFSWSPKGVLSAARNAARWRQDGQLQEIAGSNLLANSKPLTLNNALAFDVLPNRDSTAFAELYGLSHAPTFFRGTLRYRGFCDRMLAVARLGLLEPGPIATLGPLTSSGQQPMRRQWFAALLGLPSDDVASLRKALQERLCSGGLSKEQVEVGEEFVGWLGLLSDTPLPASATPLDSPIDVTMALLKREEMSYLPGERDMVAMYHELVVERANGAVERRTATLIEYAEPNGATAMSRTVGLTSAIVAQLVLDNAAPFGTGVQRPLRKEWYEPVLQHLDGEGIRMDERTELLRPPSVVTPAISTSGAAGASQPVFAAKL